MNEARQDALREIAAEMSDGERVFLANHMWKHHRVMPQRLRKYVPAEEFVTRMRAGTLVRFTRGAYRDMYTVIAKVDYSETLSPYEVFVPGSPALTTWVAADLLEEVKQPLIEVGN